MITKENLKLVVHLAIEGLKTNKGRTFLTTIGIVIGIATIIVVMSAGRGLENFILNQIESFGADTIEIEIKIPSTSDLEMTASMVGGAEITTLKRDDFIALKKIPNVDNYYAATMGQFKSVYKNKAIRSTIFAVTATFPEIDKDAIIQQGRFFTEREDNSQARVVVLGSEIKNQLFDGENAIGKNIKINQTTFKVIGITRARGNIMYFNFDKMIYVPLKTAQKQLLGVNHVMYGFVSMHDTKKTSETVEDIKRTLRKQHNIPPNDTEKEDFRVTSMEESIKMVGTIMFGMTLLVLAVAGISLVVGGVGIMNIMYLSVIERTREIGLRKAIGASNSIIKAQFLAESLIITGLGGTIGIVLGGIIIVITNIGAKLQGYDFGMSITLDAVLLGFASALLFGVLFGMYPAKKASKLSPVEALRYE
ncbi:ABC transporter permease [bacterium]|nr:ABC transporter permease [bacterium]